MSIKTQETCKPVPPGWTSAKIPAEKRACVLCVNPATCAVCAVLAVRSFDNLRWHNRGAWVRIPPSPPLIPKNLQSNWAKIVLDAPLRWRYAPDERLGG